MNEYTFTISDAGSPRRGIQIMGPQQFTVCAPSLGEALRTLGDVCKACSLEAGDGSQGFSPVRVEVRARSLLR